MKYARLEKVSEENSATSSGVRRFTYVVVKEAGAVNTSDGVVCIPQPHVGRVMRVTRSLATGLIVNIEYV